MKPTPPAPPLVLPTHYRLEDLLTDRLMLEPPEPVIPRLAWGGRVTLLAAPEKSGKSTLIGQAVAAMQTGTNFLGESVPQGPVLWFALDEPLPDLVGRLSRFGATGGVGICREQVTIAQMEALADEYDAVLIVVDTLTEWIAGAIEDPYNAHQWQGPLAAIRRIVGDNPGVAIALLHHTIRDGSRYADSRQIGAGVDQIITMREVAEDPTLRTIESRGRVTFERFRIRYLNDAYQLEQPELPLDLRVYRVIQAQPGISKRAIRDRVGGKAAAVDSAIYELVNKLAIEHQGNGKGSGYHTRPPLNGGGPGMPGHGGDTVRDTQEPDLLSPLGQQGSRTGHAPGHGVRVPPPIEGVVGHGKSEAPESDVHGDAYCPVHRAIKMENSPLTGAPACSNCTPGLFPDRARQVEGGVIVEPPGFTPGDAYEGEPSAGDQELYPRLDKALPYPLDQLQRWEPSP
jgi:hypothetical protein